MRYLVAYSADSGGRCALALGRLFGATGDVRLVVCTITPTTWGYPSAARVDAEYAEFLAGHAAKALDEARRLLGDDVDAEFVARAARTPTDGILELVEELSAGMVVLGSGQGGPLGRFTVGSVTNKLLHGAPVPVALAPRGHRPSRRARLQRVSCGFVDPEYSAGALATAVELAQRHKVPLRLVTGLVRDRQMYPSLVGYHAERLVEEQWRSDAAGAQQAALAGLPAGVEASAEIVDGTSWEDALDAVHWEEGEILVIGSGRMGLGRIFLGSNASRIIRSAPVPTMVAPGRPAP
jgi:nucleotide-binding universal stress UspA family protein